MGQVCGRRAPSAPLISGTGSADQKAIRTETSASRLRAEKAQTNVQPAKASTSKYSIDYSRFANLLDSDDEKEAEKKQESEHDIMEAQSDPRQESTESMPAASQKQSAAADPSTALVWKGKNPTEQEREPFVDDMMNLCRRLHVGISRELPNQPVTKSNRLPKDYKIPVNVLSVQQLSKYCSTNDRMLISMYGDIFDVSDRSDLYGSGCKAALTGTDITWAVVTGKETAGNCNRFYDFFKLDDDRLKRYMQIICSRLVSLENDFGDSVGRLDRFLHERDLPPPPTEEIEECNQQ